jgi:hypothetical protein
MKGEGVCSYDVPLHHGFYWRFVNVAETAQGHYVRQAYLQELI